MSYPVINGFLCHPDPKAIGIKTYVIPGTGGRPGTAPVKVTIRSEIAPLLVELMRFWHAEVEPIDRLPVDDWGYAFRAVRGSTSPSFHSAGIAVDVNATQHPLGRRGTLTRDQVARLTAKADQLGLRLGANYSGRVDEMHAEVIVSRERALRLVAALQRDPGSPAPPAPPATPGGRPTIRLGTRGDAVAEAQRLLEAKGHPVGPVDGIFGRRTELAATAFQQRCGLTADGIIGPRTWTALLAPNADDADR